MPEKKKVLVVEDDESARILYQALMGDKIEFVMAPDFWEAQKLFGKHGGQFDAIVLDGYVPSPTNDTLPLARKFRDAGYDGPMIATSSDEALCKALMAAGCDQRSAKYHLKHRLPQILGITE